MPSRPGSSPSLRQLLRWQGGLGPSSSSLSSPCHCRFLRRSPFGTVQATLLRAVSSRANRSPTVCRAARQKSPTPPSARRLVNADADTDARPPASHIFPADPSVLLAPLEEAVAVLASELSPLACLDILAASRQRYEDPAVTEAALWRDYGLTPYKMHMVALLLLFLASTTPDGARHLALAAALLHMAGTTPRQAGGYLPSTLTVLSMFGGMAGPDGRTAANTAAPSSPAEGQSLRRRLRDMQFYKDAEARFLDYLSATQAPQTAARQLTVQEAVLQANAFTQAGLVAEAGGNPARALRWFRAARDVMGASATVATDATADTAPREPQWDWERRCLEAIGRLQLTQLDGPDRRQLYQDARAAVRTAALALNSGTACLMLATDYAALGPDSVEEADPNEVDLLLYRAAAAAIPGANETLARRFEARAAKDTGHGDLTAPDVRRWAKEWRAIAAASASSPNERSR